MIRNTKSSVCANQSTIRWWFLSAIHGLLLHDLFSMMLLSSSNFFIHLADWSWWYDFSQTICNHFVEVGEPVPLSGQQLNDSIMLRLETHYLHAKKNRKKSCYIGRVTLLNITLWRPVSVDMKARVEWIENELQLKARVEWSSFSSFTPNRNNCIWKWKSTNSLKQYKAEFSVEHFYLKQV